MTYESVNAQIGERAQALKMKHDGERELLRQVHQQQQQQQRADLTELHQRQSSERQQMLNENGAIWESYRATKAANSTARVVEHNIAIAEAARSGPLADMRKADAAERLLMKCAEQTNIEAATVDDMLVGLSEKLVVNYRQSRGREAAINTASARIRRWIRKFGSVPQTDEEIRVQLGLMSIADLTTDAEVLTSDSIAAQLRAAEEAAR